MANRSLKATSAVARLAMPMSAATDPPSTVGANGLRLLILLRHVTSEDTIHMDGKEMVRGWLRVRVKRPKRSLST